MRVGFGNDRPHLALAIAKNSFAVDLHHRRARQIRGGQIGVECGRRRQQFAKVRAIALTHHQRRTSCRIGAHTAGVVHMVMRQHQIADRFARIFFLRRLDRPVRLPVGGRRIEDDQVIAHLDNQTMR